MIILLLWFIVLIIAVKLYYRQVYSHFKQNGVKHLPPVPILGNMGNILLQRESFGTDIAKLYNAFPEERFVGRYEFTNQMVLIRDVDLIKKITIKDFEYFLDHRSASISSDSFFLRNLIALKGQEWKDMRSTLSPAFTSSKIRLMVPFMEKAGDHMITAIKKKISSSDAGYIDIECKDLTTRYTNDVIATCAFGLMVDSHTDENNAFYMNGKKMMDFGFRQTLISFLVFNFPTLSQMLKLDFISSDSNDFFRTLVLGTMRDRELRQVIRPDMIHLLMQAKKGQLSHENEKLDNKDAGFAAVEESSVGLKKVNRAWSDDDLIAQAVLFFIAGFEAVSTAMSFLLYELALQPEVQNKLVKEIKDFDTKNDGQLNLKSIQEMTYLDMVVSELLRMWPPAMILDRVCTRDYNMGRSSNVATKDYIIRKGAGISIPVYAIHRDSRYFPNPDKFDPERFAENNKHKINPSAYMPFGLGPRNCIGTRFALCEVKLMIYQILLHLEVSPCERTCIPAKLSTKSLNVKLEGGHWLRFKARA